MGNCKTCKYWTEEKYGEKTTEWGVCAAGEGDNGEPVMTETLVYAADASSYHASLCTRKDFGCVMYKAN